jgi:hypothetical protein
MTHAVGRQVAAQHGQRAFGVDRVVSGRITSSL